MINGVCQQSGKGGITEVDSDSLLFHPILHIDPGECPSWQGDCAMANGNIAFGYSTPPFCNCNYQMIPVWQTDFEFNAGDCFSSGGTGGWDIFVACMNMLWGGTIDPGQWEYQEGLAGCTFDYNSCIMSEGTEHGAGGYHGAMGGRQFGGRSDITLKENIELIGKSKSGINIYEFDYKDKLHGDGRYQGVMAQEVPEASYEKEGHLWVDYSKLDVDFRRI